MPVKKNVVSPPNSFKCSVYLLVDQNLHKMQSQSIYFVKIFLVTCPQTPIICMLTVFHTMPFAVTLFKGLVHYYNMPQASKFLSTGIASIPSYTLQFEHCTQVIKCSTAIQVCQSVIIHVHSGRFPDNKWMHETHP